MHAVLKRIVHIVFYYQYGQRENYEYDELAYLDC